MYSSPARAPDSPSMLLSGEKPTRPSLHLVQSKGSGGVALPAHYHNLATTSVAKLAAASAASAAAAVVALSPQPPSSTKFLSSPLASAISSPIHSSSEARAAFIRAAAAQLEEVEADMRREADLVRKEELKREANIAAAATAAILSASAVVSAVSRVVAEVGQSSASSSVCSSSVDTESIGAAVEVFDSLEQPIPEKIEENDLSIVAEGPLPSKPLQVSSIPVSSIPSPSDVSSTQPPPLPPPITGEVKVVSHVLESLEKNFVSVDDLEEVEAGELAQVAGEVPAEELPTWNRTVEARVVMEEMEKVVEEEREVHIISSQLAAIVFPPGAPPPPPHHPLLPGRSLCHRRR